MRRTADGPLVKILLAHLLLTDARAELADHREAGPADLPRCPGCDAPRPPPQTLATLLAHAQCDQTVAALDPARDAT